MRPGATTASLATLLMAACTTVGADVAGWPERLRPRLEALAAAPPSAPAAQSVALAEGDGVTFEIVLETGGHTRRWQLCVDYYGGEQRKSLAGHAVQPFELRVVPGVARQLEMEAQQAAFREQDLDLEQLFAQIPRTPHAFLRVEAHDATGSSVGVANSALPVQLLERGLLDACRAGHRQRHAMRGRVAAGRDAELLRLSDAGYDDVLTVGRGADTCMKFVRTLQLNPVTRDILFEVLRLPSWWSILTNWGVRVTFEVDFFAAERCASSETSSEELWSVPLVLKLNDQPAMHALVLVGASDGPAGVAAGIRGIVAQHPSDADRCVHVRRTAMRRGPRSEHDGDPEPRTP